MKKRVLVIGAGPSGSLAAREAALNGAEVILIDLKSEIGSPKRCAEGVSKQGLIDLGIQPDPRWIARKSNGVRLVSPDQTSVWLQIWIDKKNAPPIDEVYYCIKFDLAAE